MLILQFVRKATETPDHDRPGAKRDGPKLRVQTTQVIGRTIRAAAGIAIAAVVMCSASLAFAALPPHVAVSGVTTTDSCAICHRAHTANAAVPYRTGETTETTGTSLLVAADASKGDVTLCFVCHGVAQLGSDKDVESSFLRSSTHSVGTTPTAYGPNPRFCSSCHDAHGSDRITTDTPYPALLRSFEGTRPVFTGEAYCSTCHAIRADERWSGLDVFKATAHYTGIESSRTATGIRCSVCHDPHGSDVAPLLVDSVLTSAAPATTAVNVTANDRTFCGSCHGATSASWPGTSTYAGSAHAASVATVAVSAKWAPVAGGRKVGECQVCHAPMGRSDGAGGTIAKLLEKPGRELCDSCHRPGGVASADTSTQAYPTAQSSAKELAVVYTPAAGSDWAGRVSLYGRPAIGGGALLGPREYGIADSGPSAAGDLDEDGKSELVVASTASAELAVFMTDPLTGLSSAPTTFALPGGKAVALSVADVVNTSLTSDVTEIALVDDAGAFWLLALDGASLNTVAGPIAVGAGPWGLAAGDVTGTALPEAVVTARGAGTMTLFADNGLFGVTYATKQAGSEPVSPVIGDVWDAAPADNDIVVLDAAAAATATVRVYDGSGDLYGGAEYLVTSPGAVPVAAAIGDILWSTPSDDLVVAFSGASGDSTAQAIPQLTVGGPGLDVAAASARSTGAGLNVRSLLIADVDADASSRKDLVVGHAGTWSRTASAVAPETQVWHADGTGAAIAASHEVYSAGGTELAGGVPSLVLADFGPALPSRHPIDEVASASHASTETAPFTRHVTCADCHDSHEAKARAASAAPVTQNPLLGAWGVSVTRPSGVLTFGAPARSATSYGVCYKCHSSYVTLGGRANVAADFAPSNAGHAIEAASASTVATDTFVVAAPAWSPSSTLYCTDCHGADGRGASQARGVHTSISAPVLGSPYAGVDPDDPSLLCYDCHRADVYATGAADGAGMSWFIGDVGQKLHSAHVSSPASGGHGVACSSCHVSHGSADAHALKASSGFVSGGAHAGTCTNGCHSAPKSYGL